MQAFTSTIVDLLQNPIKLRQVLLTDVNMYSMFIQAIVNEPILRTLLRENRDAATTVISCTVVLQEQGLFETSDLVGTSNNLDMKLSALSELNSIFDKDKRVKDFRKEIF